MDFADQLMAATNAELFAQHANDTYMKYKGNSFKIALVIDITYTFSRRVSKLLQRLLEREKERLEQPGATSTPKTDAIDEALAKRRKCVNDVCRQQKKAERETAVPPTRKQRKGHGPVIVDIPQKKMKVVYMEYSNSTKGIYDMLIEVIREMTECKMMPHTNQMNAFMAYVTGANIPKGVYVNTLHVSYSIGFYHRQHVVAASALYISEVRYDLDHAKFDEDPESPKYIMGEVGTKSHRCLIIKDMIPQIVEQMEIFNNTRAAKYIARKMACGTPVLPTTICSLDAI